MDTQRLSMYIKHPERVKSSDLNEFRAILDKYPYCSTLHLIYAKGLANSNDIRFEDALKTAAIHANDRGKLFYVLNDEKASVASEENSSEISAVNTEIPKVTIDHKVETTAVLNEDISLQPEIVETENIIAEIKLDSLPEIITSETINNAINPSVEPNEAPETTSTDSIPDNDFIFEATTFETVTKSSDSDPVELNKSDDIDITFDSDLIFSLEETEQIVSEPIETPPLETNTPPPTSSLETEILASAFESSLIFDVENIIKPEDESEIHHEEIDEESIDLETVAESLHELEDLLEDENLESEITIEEEISKTETIIEPTPFEDQSDQIISQEDELVNTPPSESMSFAEWLKFKQGKNETPIVEPAAQIIKKIEIEPIEEEVEAVPDPKLTKKEINHLLNKFIEEEPKISRLKKDFYNPAKNAKQSLDDSDILVSETLAKIYHLQKNYSKAIKAYEQLSLLNPKKKSFFANQIKKIKNQELK